MLCDLGAKTIETISTHFNGGQVPKSIAVPVKIVDANTLKESGTTPAQSKLEKNPWKPRRTPGVASRYG